MAVAAVKTFEPLVIRRFELPDMHQHGGWISKRLLVTYKHLSQATIYGWLKSIVYNREFLFLYQSHSVALAQIFAGHTLSPRPVVRECFVFAEDESHNEEAVAFYSDFVRWGKAQDAEAIILSDLSDVPEAKIREKLGARIVEKKQLFIKL
jgi:hypothetical protein